MERKAACDPAEMLISLYVAVFVSPLHHISALTGHGTLVEAFETICVTVINAIYKLLVAFGNTVFIWIFGTMFLHIFILLYPGLGKK